MEVNTLRLEIGKIYVKDIQFGPATKVENGVLFVNKEELLKEVAGDERLKSIDFDIARPGDETRIIPVKDVIEPRVKVKPVLHSLFACVTEGRIANIVREAGGLQDGTKILRLRAFREIRLQPCSDGFSKRSSNLCYLQAVSEPGVYVVVGCYRMYLCLPIESAKCAGEDDLVYVSLKGSSSGSGVGVILSMAELRVGEKLVPLHLHESSLAAFLPNVQVQRRGQA